MDLTSEPGWIEPIQAQPQTDLLSDVRFGSIGRPDRFLWLEGKPGEVRVWCPFYDAGTMAGVVGPMVDGDSTTAREIEPGLIDYLYHDKAAAGGFIVYVDLGGSYPINRIAFYPRPDHPENFMRGYEIAVYKGRVPWQFLREKEKIGTESMVETPPFDVLVHETENTQPLVDVAFSAQYVQYIKLMSLSAREFEIAELEVYGQGSVPEATYTSKIIDLGKVVNLGRIGWAGEQPLGTAMVIRTRSGYDETPLIYYSKTNIPGELREVTEKQYDKLTPETPGRPGKQGPIVYDEENWSFWSAAYARSGQEISSPAPRRYVQFQIQLLTSSPDVQAKVDSLWIEVATPVAHELKGEVSPRIVPAGKDTLFIYRVLPTIYGDDTGFDGLEIETPARATLRSLKIGGSEVPESAYNVREEERRLIVHFPNHRITSSKPVEVAFRCRVFVYGTRFLGKATDSTGLSGLSQHITPGTEDALSVEISETSLGEVLGEVEVTPEVITPNGDGVADRAAITYMLYNLPGPDRAKVALSIYDLSGALVKEVYSAREISREREPIFWYGDDTANRRVSPGMYIWRVSVHADAGSWSKMGTITVVY